MRTRATNFLCLLGALAVGGTLASVGCSGTDTNAGTGGAASTSSEKGGNGSAQGGNGMGGEAGGFIPSSGAGANDGGLDPDSACAAQSAQATLAKKPVDIIIIVDNSGSMSEEIIGVQNNINVNFAQIIEQSGIDYRVILIGTHGKAVPDESICIEAPLSGIPAGGCASPPGTPVNNPGKFYHYSEEIASHDSLCLALDTFGRADANNFAPTGWQEWLRPDSFKTFIELTDDGVGSCAMVNGQNIDDNDNATAAVTAADRWDAALLNLSPTHFGTAADRNYRFYSIVAMDYNNPADKPYDPADPIVEAMCPTAFGPGTGYQALSILTGGLRFPICDTTSFDAVFQAIAQGVIAGSKVACDFPVPPAPMGQTVDLNTVEVQYTAMGMGAPTGLTRVADAASCMPNSFYLDTVAKHVYLCPDVCTIVQQDDKAKLDVLFACEIGMSN
ncbi:MAG TPA: hypothetical protein PK156_23145 [Polyangium sp.]|nr:hypothetical protein [Polyangium sp.]